jgi:hypothetical protein
MAAGATAAAVAAREYSPLEVQRIQAAYSLTLAAYAADLPEIFVRMLEEGRTKNSDQALMHELLVPDEDNTFNAIQILVTEEMAKDFKNLDFGFNGDASYSTCHQEISPFMAILVSLAQASQRRRASKRYARVGSNLMLDDMMGVETAPDETPRIYRELMDVLKCYCFFLFQRMLEARCSHYCE